MLPVIKRLVVAKGCSNRCFVNGVALFHCIHSYLTFLYLCKAEISCPESLPFSPIFSQPLVITTLSILWGWLFLDPTYKWYRVVFFSLSEIKVLILLSIILPQFIYVVTNGRTSCLWPNNIPLCVCVCVCTLTSLFIHFLIESTNFLVIRWITSWDLMYSIWL